MFWRHFVVSWYPACWQKSAVSPNIILFSLEPFKVFSWSSLLLYFIGCCRGLYFLFPTRKLVRSFKLWVYNAFNLEHSQPLFLYIFLSTHFSVLSFQDFYPRECECLSHSVLPVSLNFPCLFFVFFPSLRAVLWIISPDLSSKPLIFFSALFGLLLSHPLSFSFLLSFSRKSS